MTPGTAAHALTVRRTFACSPQEAFDAWTDPEALVRWWGGENMQTLSAAVDLRVGGAYRLTMRNGDYLFAVEGVYREVEPPERLVYTWSWEGLDVDKGRESLVTVEFRERDDATELVVVHEGIETEKSLAFHQGGWADAMQWLEQLLPAAGQVAYDDGGEVGR